MKLGRAALACLAVLAAGCARSGTALPPPAPALARAADAIPADLDVVVRLDLARIRAALGPALLAELERAAELEPERGEGLVGRALERSDVVLIGFRPRSSAELDHVLALEGRFQGFDPASSPAAPPWLAAQDLGGDVRRWDRKRPPGRAAPARVYAKGERLMVVVTVAEIDAVERSLELGRRGKALAPPSKGVLSFAARVGPLAQFLSESSPRLARLLGQALTLEGSAELEADGLRVELALELDGAETAEHYRDALRAVLDLVGATRPAVRQLAREATIEIAGSYVVLRCTLPPALLTQRAW